MPDYELFSTLVNRQKKTKAAPPSLPTPIIEFYEVTCGTELVLWEFSGLPLIILSPDDAESVQSHYSDGDTWQYDWCILAERHTQPILFCESKSKVGVGQLTQRGWHFVDLADSIVALADTIARIEHVLHTFEVFTELGDISEEFRTGLCGMLARQFEDPTYQTRWERFVLGEPF